MSRFRKHQLSCYECGHRGEMTLTQARIDKWKVWLGGASCPDCVARRERKRRRYIAGRRTGG